MDEHIETAPQLSQAQFLRVAMDALSRRAARWAAMLMSFTLFGASAWWPDWKRTAASAAFTILVTLPIWWRKES